MYELNTVAADTKYILPAFYSQRRLSWQYHSKHNKRLTINMMHIR